MSSGMGLNWIGQPAMDMSSMSMGDDMPKDSGMAMLFISHDLGVVRHISDRVAVMYQGQIVETGDKRQIFEAPDHAYTRKLLSSIPRVLAKVA